MKWGILICGLWAGAAHAESLCGVKNPNEVFVAIAGEWNGAGALRLAMLGQAHISESDGLLVIDDAGRIELDTLVEGDQRPVLNIDAVSAQSAPVGNRLSEDFLLAAFEALNAEKITDAFTGFDCGPEDIVQIDVPLTEDEQEQLQGTVTLLPFSSDHMLFIADGRLLAGTGRVTRAMLMTRALDAE